ncbi:MAG TPA: NAD(P)-dependent oxidoreductase [Solirubrobacteraceae bacterium]|nr:NAD(P)-dependent oxidoreductase [Solirubrobacteraceae bacterium]
MRVFLAGATGAIGRHLVPLLLAEGHQVTGMTRSPERARDLQAAGAEAVVADALDADAVRAAVVETRPEAVIHQLTAIPARLDPRTIERDFVLTNRLRSEGTRHLVAAAREAGAQRVLAQSIAFAYAPGPSGALHAESEPLLSEQQAPKSFRRTAGALHELEQTVLGANGIVLRYGYFYGPGSSIARDGAMADELRRRRVPVVGRGQGVWSFIHLADAARATVAALAHAGPAVFNVVDDDPAPVAQWLPALARALHAPRPWRVPTLIARPLAGSYGIQTMTRVQGASNALAKRELDWQPHYPSWREGFRDGLG